jgi:ABC-type transporter Mla subunit MlaD
MQIRRQEILTGLLVVVTLGIVTFVVIRLGAPGVFTPLNSYYIMFDNAAGIQPGAAVLLAGRRIGQVTKLESPMPYNQRPADHKDYEVLLTVQVKASAQIYRKVTVRMVQPSLLADSVIDFTSGQQESGLAPDETVFIGVREPGVAESVSRVLAQIGPIAESAEVALSEVKDTAENLKRITSQGSEFDQAMAEFRNLGENLADMSRKGGPLHNSIDNFQDLTGEIDDIVARLNEEDSLQRTLTSFRDVANRFETVTVSLNRTLNGLDPQLGDILTNTEQMTDTLKRQPWRLIWPTTKRYPDETESSFKETKPVLIYRTGSNWRRSATGR